MAYYSSLILEHDYRRSKFPEDVWRRGRQRLLAGDGGWEEIGTFPISLCLRHKRVLEGGE